jgi:hypothetical protein
MSMAAPLLGTQRIPLSEIQQMLAALGDSKARDVISKAARELRITGSELEGRQALQMLEYIAAEPGLIGITARFAKARAILRWPQMGHERR